MSKTSKCSTYLPVVIFSCGCLPPRFTAFLVSIISLGGCLIDSRYLKSYRESPCTGLCEKVESAHKTLVTLFQIANALLLLGTIIEKAFLVQIYLWYSLGFVVTGLLLAFLEFLLHKREIGAFKSLMVFLPEVTFLVVICGCLPIVYEYTEQLKAALQTMAAGCPLQKKPQPRTSQYSRGSAGSQQSGIKLEMKPK